MPYTPLVPSDRNYHTRFNSIKGELLAQLNAVNLSNYTTQIGNWESENTSYNTALNQLEDRLNAAANLSTNLNNTITNLIAQLNGVVLLSMPTTPLSNAQSGIAQIESFAQTVTPFLTAIAGQSGANKLLSQSTSAISLVNSYSDQTLNQFYLGDYNSSGQGTPVTWVNRSLTQVYSDGITTTNLGTKTYTCWGYQVFNGVTHSRLRVGSAAGINVDNQVGGGNFGSSCNQNAHWMGAFTAANNALSLDYYYGANHPQAPTISLGQSAGTELSDCFGSVLLMSLENA